MEIKIEQTTDHEALAKLNESVQTLHHELYPEEFKAFDLATIAKAFQKMLSSDKMYAYLAKKDAQSIGYVLCMVRTREENEFQHAKRILYIDQISVEKEYRKQGVAQLLLNQVVKLATELNMDEIQLDHWTKNEVASNFFTRAGFEYYNYKMKRAHKLQTKQ